RHSSQSRWLIPLADLVIFSSQRLGGLRPGSPARDPGGVVRPATLPVRSPVWCAPADLGAVGIPWVSSCPRWGCGSQPAGRGKPLGFVDANIRCGDALLGVFDLKVLEAGIPDAAYKLLSGDDEQTAKYFEKRNKAEREGQGGLDFAKGGGRLPTAAPLAGEA